MSETSTATITINKDTTVPSIATADETASVPPTAAANEKTVPSTATTMSETTTATFNGDTAVPSTAAADETASVPSTAAIDGKTVPSTASTTTINKDTAEEPSTAAADETDSVPSTAAADEKTVPFTAAEDEENMLRSGVTGAVIGLLGGPLLSALFGFTAAYASQKKDAAGDYARSLGVFGVSMRDKATALDEKLHIAERSRTAATVAWGRAKEYDGKYNLMDKSWDYAVVFWLLFVTFVRENRLLERGVEITGRGYEYVSDKIIGKNDKVKATTALDEKQPIAPSKAASEAWDRAKEYDAKYNIMGTLWDYGVAGCLLFVTFVRENRLLERGVNITKRGYEYVKEKKVENAEAKQVESAKKED